MDVSTFVSLAISYLLFPYLIIPLFRYLQTVITSKIPLKKWFHANTWILRNISNFHFRWCISCGYAFATVISSMQGNKITTCKMQQPYHRNNNTLMQTIFTPQAWLSTFVHLQLLHKPSSLPVSWVLLKYCNVMFSVFQNTMCLSNPSKTF